MRLIFISIVYIFIEIALFSSIGGQIGTLPVLLLVVTGFFLGIILIRRSGQNTANWLLNARNGQATSGISTQIAPIISGILFIIPGFFSDFLAILLLFTPTRNLILKLFSFRTLSTSSFTTHPQSSPDTIEGEVIESDRKPHL